MIMRNKIEYNKKYRIAFLGRGIVMSRYARLILILVLVFSASTVLAQSPHYVVGPDFTVNADGTVTASGSIAGLGNWDITVVLTAELSVEVLCRNPGGNIAPGQTQQTTVSGTVENIEVKNGRATFSVTTDAPTLSGSPKELGCPNNRWTAEIGNVELLSATLDVYQQGQLVLSTTYP
jgi:hypothetical protein